MSGEIPLFERHMPHGSPWRGQLLLPKIGLHSAISVDTPVLLWREHLQQKENGFIPSPISFSQSNTKLTLIENKKPKKKKKSRNKVEAFGYVPEHRAI